MLEMYGLPGGDICQIHGKKFVNDRLIGLMDDLISELVVSICDISEGRRLLDEQVFESGLRKC